MNTSDNADPPTVRALRQVGMLDRECWGDEREREVYLESSQIALSIDTWGVLIVAALMPWFLGESGALWSLAVMGPVGLGGFASMYFSRSQGVPTPRLDWWKKHPTAGAAYFAIVAVWAVGYLLAVSRDEPLDLSTAIGFLAGAAVSIGLFWALVTVIRRRVPSTAVVPDDVFDDGDVASS